MMKKKRKSVLLLTLFLCISVFICSCSNGSTILKDSSAEPVPDIKKVSSSPLGYADGFASDIAVVPKDAKNSAGSDKVHSEGALLIDATEGKVLFQKNAHHREYPASTTKVLTALLALKYGDKTSSRIIGDEVIINESNVILCDYRMGDEVPFDVAIHGALLKSGNDAAAALALFASDSLSDFADLMNEEAQKIGATESHFVNPHGLYDDNHYTTPYDLYLIFNEAIKNPDFVDVLSCTSYSGSFNRNTAYGSYIINVNYNNTNQYLAGRAAPEHVKVIGGKAGYTEVAKRSYVMLAEANGHKYIFVTMRCDDAGQVYEDLDYLLSLIPDESADKKHNSNNKETQTQNDTQATAGEGESASETTTDKEDETQKQYKDND